MGSYIEPTHGVIYNVTINGQDFTPWIMSVKVFETICKPYRTGTVTLRDNNGLIEDMQIAGGEPVSLVFGALPNEKPYDVTMHILALQGRNDPENFKSIIYNIDLIEMPYYEDRSQVAQTAHKDQQVTAAIQEVFGKYIHSDTLKIISEGTDMIKEAYNISNKKPFTGMYDLMKLLATGSYAKGNALLYKDKDNINLASLEDLITKKVSQETFYQRETWGKDFFDVNIYQAIIYAEAKSNRGNAGRSGTSEASATMSQGRQVFDWATANIVFQSAKNMIGGGGEIGSMLKSFIGPSAGGLGGSPNIMTTNSQQTPDASAPWRKVAEEKAYSASVRNGPQLELAVPMQTGLNCTVGKGITVYLVPAGADIAGNNPNKNSMNGDWLVTDLVHASEGENQQVRSTTTMQCVRGEFGQ